MLLHQRHETSLLMPAFQPCRDHPIHIGPRRKVTRIQFNRMVLARLMRLPHHHLLSVTPSAVKRTKPTVTVPTWIDLQVPFVRQLQRLPLPVQCLMDHLPIRRRVTRIADR